MYFPLQRLADTTSICGGTISGGTIKGAEDDLIVLLQQLKECGFRVEASEPRLLNVDPDWRIDINLYVEQKEFLKLKSKLSSNLSATFEGLKEDLSVLIAQFKGCGFNLKISDFYPSYRSSDQRMISRVYIEFEVS
ncbi:MAG: hypothetical protein WBB28_08605 [Crinalium sp.]